MKHSLIVSVNKFVLMCSSSMMLFRLQNYNNGIVACWWYTIVILFSYTLLIDAATIVPQNSFPILLVVLCLILDLIFYITINLST